MKQFAVLCCLFGLASAQIQIYQPPRPGFTERIRKAVDRIRIIDTHEHLLPESERIKRADQLDFTYLYSHYANEDLVSAGGNRSVINAAFSQDFTMPERWELFKPNYERMKNTGYAKVIDIVNRDLFGVAELNEAASVLLTKKVREASRPGWYETVLRQRARIELVIVDGYSEQIRGDAFKHVERFGDYITAGTKAAIQNLLAGQGLTTFALQDYIAALRSAFIKAKNRGMIGVKTGLAYQRILKFDRVEQDQANRIFSQIMAERPVAAEEIKAWQDYMMHRVLDLCDEFTLPMQIHTGLQAGNGNVITNSNPTHLVNLFIEYPDVDFILFHGAYPYGGELATLAKNFPNVFIDMCWTPIISPSYSIRYLHEWLETVPANKIMAFGGDFSVVEAIYGHSVMARQVVARVLAEKVADGYFTEEEAITVAQRLLHDNALEVFQLDNHSRRPDRWIVLQRPGPLADWWQLQNSRHGFVKVFKVIGPFEFGAGLDQPLSPEQDAGYDLEHETLSGRAAWQIIRTPSSGYLNFASLYGVDGVTPRAMAYAAVKVKSPDDRRVKLSLGSNDGAKMWVNGKVVYNFSGGRSAVPDQAIIETELKKGENRILVKVENLGANWGLYVRLVDPDKELQVLEN